MLTAERLRELLCYDPGTGEFTRLVCTYRRGKVGSRADVLKSDGYRYVSIDGAWYLAHRLAWLYVHGALPTLGLDHKDRDRGNNRILNLRQATHSQNGQNVCRAFAHSRSGLLGVSYHPPLHKWMARLYVERRFVWCGYHETPEAAHAAYLAAKLKHHPFQTLVLDGLEL